MRNNEFQGVSGNRMMFQFNFINYMQETETTK